MNNRIEQLNVYLKQTPDDPFLNHAMGVELMRNGEMEKALMSFEKVIVVDPDYTGTYYQLGKLYEELGRTVDAKNTYIKGMEVAKKQRDQHAFGELQQALMLLDEI